MQLQHPLGVVTPTLDGKVLEVLARADDWFSISTIISLLGHGSPAGVRKVLNRLIVEGIVEENSRGHGRLYRFQRHHLAAPHILGLLGMREELVERMRRAISLWSPAPVFVTIFGSAARGSQRPDSDIDICIVHKDEVDPAWIEEADALVSHVARWTGNDARAIWFSESEVLERGKRDKLLASVLSEGVSVFGTQRDLKELMHGDPEEGRTRRTAGSLAEG